LKSIATLGSHCALQLLKGAKDEGFKTIIICEKKREKLYRRFLFIDEFILVDSFLEILEQRCSSALDQNDAILIPHGTLISQMSSEQIESINSIDTIFFKSSGTAFKIKSIIEVFFGNSPLS